MKPSILLRGGRLVDPGLAVDGPADVRISAGLVTAVGRLTPDPGERVVDVDGLTVAPGLVDVHVHLREPGHEWKETIGTGTTSAAAGGFTTLFCMPNTEPSLDSVAMLEEFRRRANRDSVVHVHPIATISEGRRGAAAVDYDALVSAGAVAFSDDGESTADSGIMVQALVASRRLGRPVMVHCEDPALIGGAMHEGDVSRQLGIRGISAAAEEIFIDRDLALAEQTGGWLHVCHVSTGRGAAAVARARNHGARVTAEVMPHHLMMADAWIAGPRVHAATGEPVGDSAPPANPDTKVNPPLRPAADAARLLSALQRKEIDLVSTDHAPHSRPEKQGRTFQQAAFGMHGSEVALPVMLSLVRDGFISLGEVIAAMSTTPARLWGLNCGTLRPGMPADVVVFDPDERWKVTANRLLSRSANTPLVGATLQGRVKLTLVNGAERYRDW